MKIIQILAVYILYSKDHCIVCCVVLCFLSCAVFSSYFCCHCWRTPSYNRSENVLFTCVVVRTSLLFGTSCIGSCRIYRFRINLYFNIFRHITFVFVWYSFIPWNRRKNEIKNFCARARSAECTVDHME